MSEFDKERVREVLVNADEVTGSIEPFRPSSGAMWYTDRSEVISDVEEAGSRVVGSASCDMADLLTICEERGWIITAEAGGVYCVRKGDADE